MRFIEKVKFALCAKKRAFGYITGLGSACVASEGRAYAWPTQHGYIVCERRFNPKVVTLSGTDMDAALIKHTIQRYPVLRFVYLELIDIT